MTLKFKIERTKFIEILAIKIPCGNSEILVASVYIPPSKGRFKEMKGVFCQLGEFYVIAGDLNSHNPIWDDRKTSETGRYLERVLPLFDARLHIPPDFNRTHPTNPDKDAVLDYCISHGTLNTRTTGGSQLTSESFRRPLAPIREEVRT